MTNQQIYNAGAAAFKVGKLRSDNPWDDNKAGASREAHGIWDRAWVDESKKLPKITLDALEIGDTVAEMHCHQTNFGKMKGWTVGTLFEISEEMYDGIRAQFPTGKNEGRVIANKYAQVVSIRDDFQYNVTEVLVIYVYDFTYYMTTLSYPKVS